MHATRLAIEDAAARVGVAPSLFRAWMELGLLTEAEGGVDARALARARLLRHATDRGLSAEAIAEATRRDPVFLDRFLDIVGVQEGEPTPLADAAAEAGLDESFVRRLRVAGALADGELFPEDVEALRAVRVALDVGLPEDAILQLVRVLSDSLGRVADAESRLFHIHFHERLRAEGVGREAIAAAVEQATGALLGLMEPTILYFHRKAWTSAMRDDLVVHLAEEIAPADGAAGRLPVAVLFVDLAGYTPLTESMGDAAAAAVVARFSELVREQVLECGGRVVKQIGDEFMLVFPTATAAVRFGAGLAEQAAAQPGFPPLRMGAHTGAALYREADYLGATVNIAARVASQAKAGQLLVTRAVVAATEPAGWSWRSVGTCSLKGVTEPVELFVPAEDWPVAVWLQPD